jgi:hypothetical protein
VLRIVTKDEYWTAEDEGHLDKITYDPAWWHIRQIQDTMVLKYIGDRVGASILEVGNGASRTLPWLSIANTCINVDELRSKDGEPTKGTDAQNVDHIYAKVGETQDVILAESQDIVYSVSVLEHIPLEALPTFYADISRMLRSGGQMIHLIDCYLRASGEDNSFEVARRQGYMGAFDIPGLQAFDDDEILPASEVGFHPTMASNPDRIMNDWNHIVPHERPNRLVSQGCTWVQRAVKQ